MDVFGRLAAQSGKPMELHHNTHPAVVGGDAFVPQSAPEKTRVIRSKIPEPQFKRHEKVEFRPDEFLNYEIRRSFQSVQRLWENRAGRPEDASAVRPKFRSLADKRSTALVIR